MPLPVRNRPRIKLRATDSANRKPRLWSLLAGWKRDFEVASASNRCSEKFHRQDADATPKKVVCCVAGRLGLCLRRADGPEGSRPFPLNATYSSRNMVSLTALDGPAPA